MSGDQENKAEMEEQGRKEKPIPDWHSYLLELEAHISHVLNVNEVFILN